MQGVSTFSAKSMQFKSVIGHLMVSVTLNRSLPFHHLNQSSYHSFHIWSGGGRYLSPPTYSGLCTGPLKGELISPPEPWRRPIMAFLRPDGVHYGSIDVIRSFWQLLRVVIDVLDSQTSSKHTFRRNIERFFTSNLANL